MLSGGWQRCISQNEKALLIKERQPLTGQGWGLLCSGLQVTNLASEALPGDCDLTNVNVVAQPESLPCTGFVGIVMWCLLLYFISIRERIWAIAVTLILVQIWTGMAQCPVGEQWLNSVQEVLYGFGQLV